MLTHQNIRGKLKKNGFKTGKRFEADTFSVMNGFENSIRVEYNTGGYNMYYDKGIKLVNEVIEVLTKEGYVVERATHPLISKEKVYSKFDLIVSEK